MIRLVIVADSLSRARELATLLAEDDRMDIIEARAANGRMVDARADVVLCVGLSHFQTASSHVPVVLIGDSRADIGGNVRALLPLSASAAEISAAVQAAANDLTVLTHEQLLRWMPAQKSHMQDDTPVEELTPRELQVLNEMAAGNGNKDIALALGISGHTVKFHVAQILAKLNAATRTEAVAIGIRRGLIAI